MPDRGTTPVFHHRIRVTWADCDPALIAFTGRIPYWALEAIEAWWKAHVGLDWYELNVDRGIGTPFVRMELDFRAPITPRDDLVCTVCLVHAGRTSVRHAVKGYQAQILCFEGTFVSAFVDGKSLTSREPPPDIARVFSDLENGKNGAAGEN